MQKTSIPLLALVLATAVVIPSVARAQMTMGPQGVKAPPTKSGFAAFTDSVGSGFKRGVDKISQTFNPKGSGKVVNDPTGLSSAASPGPELYLAVAKSHEEAGRFTEAEAQYDKALDEQPKHLPTMIARAEFLDRRGRVKEAAEQYEKATRVHSRDALAWNHLGLFHADHRELDKAVAALEQAVMLDPNQALYRNNLATVLVKTGRTGDALNQLLAVHDEATANYNLGFLLQQSGRNDAAEQQFAAALRCNPEMSEAKAWLEHMQSLKSAPARSVATGRANTSSTASIFERQIRSPEARRPVEPSVRVASSTASVAQGESAPVVQQLPPVPKRRETVAQRPDLSSRPLWSNSSPPLPKLTLPEAATRSGVVDQPAVTQPVAPLPSSGPIAADAVAPLPPVSAPPSTPAYGTPNTNVIYPLPPTENGPQW